MCGRVGRVCVYAGSGAVLARDVDRALDKLGIPHLDIDEDSIRRGILQEHCGVLIVPGGYTAAYIPALGVEGFSNIREFVARGGVYIGICAGAYIAARRVEVPGHPEGLGIINITNTRRRGMGIIEITVTKPHHPIARGCPRRMRIWYQNGPYIEPGRGVEVIARYDEKYAAVVCSRYGDGAVVIFSPHPEGSLEHGVEPEKLGTIKLLENAIEFGGG